MHPDFKQQLWFDAKKLNDLYDDKKFKGLVKEVLGNVESICDNPTRQAFSPHYEGLILNHSELKKLHEMFCTDSKDYKEANFWTERGKELCLWSFIVSIACTIVKLI